MNHLKWFWRSFTPLDGWETENRLLCWCCRNCVCVFLLLCEKEERGVLELFKKVVLKVFSPLSPMGNRKSGKLCCSELCVFFFLLLCEKEGGERRVCSLFTKKNLSYHSHSIIITKNTAVCRGPGTQLSPPPQAQHILDASNEKPQKKNSRVYVQNTVYLLKFQKSSESSNVQIQKQFTMTIQ